MAAITKAALSSRILEYIGVKAPDQSANAADDGNVQKAIDAAYARIDRRRKVPFPLTAIPDEAQEPLRDYVASFVALEFGITGERLQALIAGRVPALQELALQYSTPKQPLRTEATYF